MDTMQQILNELREIKEHLAVISGFVASVSDNRNTLRAAIAENAKIFTMRRNQSAGVSPQQHQSSPLATSLPGEKSEE